MNHKDILKTELVTIFSRSFMLMYSNIMLVYIYASFENNNQTLSETIDGYFGNEVFTVWF